MPQLLATTIVSALPTLRQRFKKDFVQNYEELVSRRFVYPPDGSVRRQLSCTHETALGRVIQLNQIQ